MLYIANPVPDLIFVLNFHWVGVNIEQFQLIDHNSVNKDLCPLFSAFKDCGGVFPLDTHKAEIGGEDKVLHIGAEVFADILDKGFVGADEVGGETDVVVCFHVRVGFCCLTFFYNIYCRMPDLFQVFFTFFRGIVSNCGEDKNIYEGDNESAHVIGTTTPKKPNDDGKGEKDDGDDGLFHNVFFYLVSLYYMQDVCQTGLKFNSRAGVILIYPHPLDYSISRVFSCSFKSAISLRSSAISFAISLKRCGICSINLCSKTVITLTFYT